MTTELKAGDQVIASRTTLKAAYIRKNGEHIPEKLVTRQREGKLLIRSNGGWLVEWRDAAHRRRAEHFFDHEIVKQGTAPLLLKASSDK